MSQEWTEVNIIPVSSKPREILLVETIDVLVHDALADRVDTWFFGWYTSPEERHLRLRIRWKGAVPSGENNEMLFNALDVAQSEGNLARWWQGKHGVRGEIYQGEEDTYGSLWELLCLNWHSSSELALALVRMEPGNMLSEARQRQWDALAHMHANRLGWGNYIEAFISLNFAKFYLTESGKANPELTGFVETITQVFSDLMDKLAAGPSIR